MRLAFASDMHGNLPAFEAVLAELDRSGPFDGIFGGGDSVINGLYPAECVQLLIDRNWECVLGNADEWSAAVGTGSVDGVELTPDESEQRDALLERGRWTAARLNETHLAFLGALPLSRVFTGPSGKTLMLAHATPWSAHVAVRQGAEEGPKREMLDRAGTDALIYGHIHYGYQQQIDGRTLCCMGAVGLPYDGDPRASFAIATDEGDGWSFEHVRVPYDNEAYAFEVENSDMPNAMLIAELLRKEVP
jgi:predicted phosphodiesterase